MINYLELGAKIVVLVLGWMMVIFLMWRRFRLDLEENNIFTFGIVSLIVIVWLGLGLKMWIGVILLMTTLVILSGKFGWDSYELGDFLTPWLFTCLSIIDIKLLFLAIFSLVVMYTFRKFKWYKSGKPGLVAFSGLSVFGVFVVLTNFGLSFVDQVAGIWLLTGSIVSIYLRSRLN